MKIRDGGRKFIGVEIHKKTTKELCVEKHTKTTKYAKLINVIAKT